MTNFKTGFRERGLHNTFYSLGTCQNKMYIVLLLRSWGWWGRRRLEGGGCKLVGVVLCIMTVILNLSILNCSLTPSIDYCIDSGFSFFPKKPIFSGDAEETYFFEWKKHGFFHPRRNLHTLCRLLYKYTFRWLEILYCKHCWF